LDLIEITLAPLTVKYIATISNSSLVWTEKEIRWSGGELQVAVPSTSERPIVVKPPDALGWTAKAPTVAARPGPHETSCASAEPESR
jgi:hypothetical protein